MPATGLMDDYEQAMKAAVSDTVLAVRDVLALLGDRPWGYIQGTRAQQLEQFLSMRDDPGAWKALIADWEKVGGRQAAERAAVAEFKRLEAMLERAGGAEAVRAALAMKRIGVAATVVQRAQKHLDRPLITILPPLTAPKNDLEMLGVDPALVQQALGALGEDGSKDQKIGNIAPPMSLDMSLGAPFDSKMSAQMAPSQGTPMTNIGGSMSLDGSFGLPPVPPVAA